VEGRQINGRQLSFFLSKNPKHRVAITTAICLHFLPPFKLHQVIKGALNRVEKKKRKKKKQPAT